MVTDPEYDNPDRRFCQADWTGFEGVKAQLKFYLSCLNSQDVLDNLQIAEDGTATLTLPLHRLHDLVVDAMHFE